MHEHLEVKMVGWPWHLCGHLVSTALLLVSVSILRSCSLNCYYQVPQLLHQTAGRFCIGLCRANVPPPRVIHKDTFLQGSHRLLSPTHIRLRELVDSEVWLSCHVFGPALSCKPVAIFILYFGIHNLLHECPENS